MNEWMNAYDQVGNTQPSPLHSIPSSHLLCWPFPQGSFPPLWVRPTGTSHGTLKPKQWAEKWRTRGVARLREGSLQQRASLMRQKKPRKLDKMFGATGLPRNRLHGCPGSSQKVSGPKFPEPKVSVVACDPGYVHWLQGTQGGSFPGQPTLVCGSSDAWGVLQAELKSSSL